MTFVIIEFDDPTLSAKALHAWDWASLLDTPNIAGVDAFDTREQLERAVMTRQYLFAVSLNAADDSEPDNWWIEFYWAEDDERAEEQARNAYPKAAVLSTPTRVPYVMELRNGETP